jgi:hypothetical protein
MMPTDAIPEPLRQLFNTPETPELGPGPRAGVMSQTAIEQQLRALLSQLKISDERRELVRAAVLLWHDQHDPSHGISQGIDSADGSLLHAILHRREPDYWNSKYWFRKVGKHPTYTVIARQVGDFLKSGGDSKLAARLVPRGEWDAYAFVDVCEEVADLPGTDGRKAMLRTIQQIEFEAVLEYLCGA